MDMRATGHQHSWSNQAQGSRRMIGRLDRALINAEWLLQDCPDGFVEYLNPGVSDHSPLSITLKP